MPNHHPSPLTRCWRLALALVLIFPMFSLFVATPHVTKAATPNKLGVNLAGFYDLPYLKGVAGAVGEWGYVGVVVSPEQVYRLPDFLLNCYNLHLTPVLRLAATKGGTPDQPWPRPTTEDALRWANALNNLDWHGLPRIIAVGNEMNLFSEWGGTADPAGYADYLVTLARTLRATSNPDSKYTILMGAVTLGAPDLDGVAISPMTFIAKMKQHMPDVFNYVDGTAINIYSIRPYTDLQRWNIFGYKLQQQLMGVNKPVYILEAGLDPHFAYTDQDSADFLRLAWPDWQNDPNVVTAMPLAYVPKEYVPGQTGGQPFWFFHLNSDGSLNSISRTYAAMSDIYNQPDHLPVLTDQERLIRSFWPADKSSMPAALYFPEVKHNLDAHFVAAWQQGGGLAMFGYPLHEATIQGGNLVQYTERARFEFHPNAGQACCTNGTLAFGLLGQEAITLHNLSFDPAIAIAGSVVWSGALPNSAIPPTATPAPKRAIQKGTPTVPPTATPISSTVSGLYFNETKHNLSDKFLDYWEQRGGLATFGYPLSEAYTDNGLTIQYFERVRMELHGNDVQLGLLGYEIARSFDYKGYW